MANYHIGRLTMDCILAGRGPRTAMITDPTDQQSVDPVHRKISKIRSHRKLCQFDL